MANGGVDYKVPPGQVVIAGVMHIPSGKIYTATNGPGGKRPTADPGSLNEKLNPHLQSMLDKPDKLPHFSNPGAHAEVVALNQAMNEHPESPPSDFMVDTAWLKGGKQGGSKYGRGDEAPLCANCQVVVNQGTKVDPELEKLGVITLPPDAPPPVINERGMPPPGQPGMPPPGPPATGGCG
jgi:hypothetical protein